MVTSLKERKKSKEPLFRELESGHIFMRFETSCSQCLWLTLRSLNGYAIKHKTAEPVLKEWLAFGYLLSC